MWFSRERPKSGDQIIAQISSYTYRIKLISIFFIDKCLKVKSVVRKNYRFALQRARKDNVRVSYLSPRGQGGETIGNTPTKYEHRSAQKCASTLTRVKDVDLIEALVLIVAAKHHHKISNHGGAVVRAGGRV